MKNLARFASLCGCVALASAQTATSDDTTSSGAKVGTGIEPGISAPAETGPRPNPERPGDGLIATPPPGLIPSPTPPVVPNAGPGAAAGTESPAAGISTGGAGTGR